MAGVKGKSGRRRGVPNGLSAYDRIMRRTDKPDGEEGCWLWLGSVDKISGYGHTKTDGVAEYNHRIVWAEHNGAIPAGMTIDHLCHDSLCNEVGAACKHRRCVNPRHLKAVTHQENNRRANGPRMPSRSGGNTGGHQRTNNYLKTGCPYDHGPYDGIYSNGYRYCKQCKCEKESRRRARKKPD